MSTEKYVEAQEYGISMGMGLSETETSVRRETLIKYVNKKWASEFSELTQV